MVVLSPMTALRKIQMGQSNQFLNIGVNYASHFCLDLIPWRDIFSFVFFLIYDDIAY